MCSCFTVNPKEEVVLLDFGKYNGTVKDPGMIILQYSFVTHYTTFSYTNHIHTSTGCHFVCSVGRTMNRVSTKVKSIMIPETKTIDRNGNPLIINGILAYQVRNAKRATLDVEYPCQFKRKIIIINKYIKNT